MPRFVPLSVLAHAGKRLRRSDSFAFSVHDVLVPLGFSELPEAASALPVVLIRQGDSFMPAALLGLSTGRNLFLAPNGRWLARYIPAVLRAYPFRLGPDEKGVSRLEVDEESPLLTDSADGLRLFEADGRLSQPLVDVADFLTRSQGGHEAAVTACAALARAGLVRPIVLSVQAAGEKHELQGLFRVDEAALNALPGPAYLELRAAGALLVANCQLLSLHHVPLLGELAEAHAGATPAVRREGADAFFGEGGVLSFKGLQ